MKCAEALALTAKAEGWHRPIIDRILELMNRRAGQLRGQRRS
jgi:hypothetical protein